MIKYIDKFPPFGEGKYLPENKILELVKFSVLKERQKELIIQGFEAATQGLTELVEFCERLETSKEIFQMQGKGNHQKQKTSGPVNATNLPSRRRAKVQTRT